MKHVLDFIGMEVELDLETDSSAAMAVMYRSGVGKIRHLEVKTLWIQKLVEDGILHITKVAGEKNVADIGTKILPASRMRALKEMLGIMTLEQAQARATLQQVGAVSSSARRGLLALLASSLQGVRGEDSTCNCNSSNMFMMVLWTVTVLAFGIGSWIYWRSRATVMVVTAPAAQRPLLAPLTRTLTRTVGSQAPVTYKRNYSQPRFVCLAEHSHG